MKKLTVGIIACLFVVAASAQAWQPWKSDKYGIKMLIPGDAKGQAKELGDGWAGLAFKSGADTIVLCLAKRGYKGSKLELQKAAIKITEIAGPNWKLAEEGANWHGFQRYQTWLAKDGKHLVIACIGVGPIGSYLIFVQTTPQTFAANQKDFATWGDSIYVE